MDFSEYQDQLANQMREDQSSGNKALKESAADIRMAAMELRSVATESRRQSDSLKQIANPVSGNLSSSGSFVARGINNISRPFMGQGGVYASPNPGDVGVKHIGAFNSMMGAFGINYDPRTSQQFDAGAMQRAYGRQINEQVSSAGRGMLSGVARNMSFSNLGSSGGGFIAGSIHPWLAGVGSTAGGAVMAPLDMINPMSYAADQIDMHGMFSGVAGRNSNMYLRGRSGVGGVGRFSQRERSMAASGMRKVAHGELSYDAGEIADISSNYVDEGLYLGVQSPEQFAARTKDLVESHKRIRKALNLSNREMTQYMKQTFDQIGVDPSMQSGLGQYTTQVRATAHMGGLSVQDSARIGLAGAAGARGFGLMNLTGAQTALGGAALAGQGATNSVSTALLATVGGEQGLARLLAGAQNKFLQGSGGMSLGLGGSSGSVDDVIKGLQRGVGSSGDLVNFLGNQNKRTGEAVNRIGAHGVQAQQAMQLYDLAKKVAPDNSPETIRSTMVMLAQQQYDVDLAGAQAMVDSFASLPDTISKSASSGRQTRSDAVRDTQIEKNSISGRIRGTYRNTMENAGAHGGIISGVGSLATAILSPSAYLESQRRGGGLGNVVDSVAEDYATLGDRTEKGVNNAQDWFYGVDRSTYGQEDVGGIRSAFNKEERGTVRDSRSASDILRARKLNSSDSAKLKEYLSRAMQQTNTKSGINRGFIDDAKRSIDALRSNHTRFRDGNSENVTDQELFDMASGMGIGTRDDRKNFSRATGIQEENSRVRVSTEDEIVDQLEGLGMIFNGSLAADKSGIVRAAQDKEINTLRRLLSRFVDSYDQEAIDQSPENQKLERRVVALYKKINSSNKPGSTKSFAAQLLSSSGATVTGNKLRLVGPRGAASIRGSGGSFDKIEEQAIRTHRRKGIADAYAGGLGRLGGKMGINISSNIDEKSSVNARASESYLVVEQLANEKSTEELVEMMRDENLPQEMRDIARLAGQFKQSKPEDRDKDYYGNAAMNRLQSLGVDTLGADTVKSVDGTTGDPSTDSLIEVNKANIQVLNELSRILKEVE